MARHLTTVLTGFGAAAASVLLLAGCASPGSAGGSTDGSDDAAVELELDATWLDDGRVVGLVTQGSSTCVPSATDVSYENGVLSVTLDDGEAQACTKDLVPRLSLVSLPEDVDPTASLEIAVTYGDAVGDTDLDGIAGLGSGSAEEGTPSAAWVGDDELALLTWGSSSRACYPVAESIVVDDGVITATMAEPAADQVCTSDYGPQGSLLFVDGAADDTEYELVLTGFGFEGDVRVPIIGTP
ncbi:hypothetical protein MN032_11950 [Agromyces atrinae]|uniref:hypothetical protein n=1 Tax=Agromyces atrinae TaxID=592376 RepID=UPI001F5ACF0A|nr:hypothetical protein [Agromyces atrinae]MCI2958407.1 hypothetical protein [Agromyces atrinae]